MKTCHRNRFVALFLFASLLVLPLANAGPKIDKHLELTKHLPRDPVGVAVMTVDDLGRSWDEVISKVHAMLGEEKVAEMDSAIAEIDAKLGVSIRNDLLPLIGPECALTFDIPPIDQAFGAVMAPSDETFRMVLGKIAIIEQTKDAKKLDEVLRTMAAALGAQVSDAGGLVKISVPLPESEQGPKQLNMFYAIENGILAFGFDPDWLTGLLKPQQKAASLLDGADFQKVVGNLDTAVENLAYVNIPRIGELVTSSEILKGSLASDEEAQAAYNIFFTEDNLKIGWGMTSFRVEEGVRQTTFGPKWMSGGAATAGIIAAIAVPNFINAIDSGREKRTMADMRTVAVAIGAYAVDNNVYPGPTDGWVDVEYLREYVEPMYVRLLPSVDGWGNVMKYRSDGQHYTLVSFGNDGQLDRDWTLDISADDLYNDDIVHSDGEFVVFPEE